MTIPGTEATDLPRIEGRSPRIAMLVYNDAENDARVLKEAAAARDAGAEVRILAVARDLVGRHAGVSTRLGGVELSRVQEFTMAAYLPWIAPLTRRLAGATRPRPGGAPTQQARRDAPSSPGETRPRPRALARARSRAVRLLADVGDRTFRTVALAHYWRLAVQDLLHWRPDIVHANDGNTLLPAVLAARFLGAGCVYDSHELWRHRNIRQDRLLAPHVEAIIESWAIRRVDAVITVSPSIVRWLQSRYALPEAPALVRNVPAAAPMPTPEHGRLRELAGLSASTRVIAYGGRITSSRGLEEVLHALPLLPEGVHLVMLGYGESTYLDPLWQLARDLRVEDRVHRVGPVAPSEVSTALADGDVSVVHVRPDVLSYEFALPNKLFESIRGGLPIAAADLPDIRGVVTELGVGRLFEGDDPADLARTIEAILADPTTYREAARRAAPQMIWERESAVLIDVYRRVLARRP
ncbi:MAG: glycosyltransferase [Brachybacterium sp.]|nr:glycosyltransferase [Brachybacterium sp.]